MSSQRMFAVALFSIFLVITCAKPTQNSKPDEEFEFELAPKPVLYSFYEPEALAFEKRSAEAETENNERNIRSSNPLGTMRFGKRSPSPLGTMRFGKRDVNPLGTMRFGKREPSPLGTMRFGKRSQSPLGTMRFGKRNPSPLGTMRFGKRSLLDYEYKPTPLGTMRFGKRSTELFY